MESSASFGETVRVLHVDDDPEFAEVTVSFLERIDHRFDAEIVTSVAEGLARLSAGGVDCVVSDYDMPGRTGIEFLEAVREGYPDLPFILYTGKGSEEVASDAISAGVTDYLQKGSGSGQYEVLANRIRNAVGRSRQRRRLRTLIDNLPGIVYQCRNEPGWPMVSIGGEVEALTGYPPDEITRREGLFEEELIHPNDRERVRRAVKNAIDADDPFEVTYRIRTATGEIRWVWERGQQTTTTDGDVEILEGFITDVTERHRTRRELEAEREFVGQAIDTLDDLFYVLGADGELRRWNDRVNEITGRSDAELDSMRAADLFPTDEHARLGEAIEETIRTGSTVVELDILDAEGGRHPHQFTGSRLSVDGGDPDGLVGIGRSLSTE